MSITGLPGDTSWQVSSTLTTPYHWSLRAEGIYDWLPCIARLPCNVWLLFRDEVPIVFLVHLLAISASRFPYLSNCPYFVPAK